MVYDTKMTTFSTPNPSQLQNAVDKQLPIWGIAKRVQALLRPSGDLVTVIEGVLLHKREVSDEKERCYVLVSGHSFSFGSRFGRDFFDPKQCDVRLKFGPVVGPIWADLLCTHFPSSVQVA